MSLAGYQMSSVTPRSDDSRRKCWLKPTGKAPEGTGIGSSRVGRHAVRIVIRAAAKIPRLKGRATDCDEVLKGSSFVSRYIDSIYYQSSN
ncbi:hypothetical protein D3C86_1753360 [compost metagenome]